MKATGRAGGGRSVGKMWQSVKDFFAHPIIRMALALGASTVVLAYFSKRVAAEPLMHWELGLPAFVASLFQGFAVRRKSSRFSRTWIGILLVVLATAVVIGLNI